MANRILWTFIVNDVLFLLTGGIILSFALISENDITSPQTAQNIKQDLLLAACPLKASVANAVLIFVTFLFSLPAMVMPTSRGWLKVHGYMTVVCAAFTLVLGLDIWFDTLRSRSRLAGVWALQPASSQSLLQQDLSCCGYMNSASPAFIVDSFCSSAAVAAAAPGCVGAFSTFANNYLDVVFTAAFGCVGIDVALLLSTTMLLKDRRERERYRHLDQKHGVAGF